MGKGILGLVNFVHVLFGVLVQAFLCRDYGWWLKFWWLFTLWFSLFGGDFNSAFFQVEGVQVGGCRLNSILRFSVIFVIWKGFWFCIFRFLVPSSVFSQLVLVFEGFLMGGSLFLEALILASYVFCRLKGILLVEEDFGSLLGLVVGL